MRFDLLRRVLNGRRGSLLGWSLGLTALMLLIVFSYPAVRDQPGFAELLEDMPDFVQQLMGLTSGLDILSPAGYLNARVYSNILPILLLVFLIGFAGRETAGEERNGTIDLLLAHPVTRTRVFLEITAAVLGCGLLLGAVTAGLLIGLGPFVGLDVPIAGHVAATLASVFVAWVFAATALLVAAWTGSRTASVGVATGLVVGTYVLWGLAPLVGALDPTNPANPWHWALSGRPVLDGIQGANLLVLLGITAGLIALAVVGFRRRDLGV